MDELQEMQQRASSEANGASLSLDWVARSEPPTELRASRIIARPDWLSLSDIVHCTHRDIRLQSIQNSKGRRAQAQGRTLRQGQWRSRQASIQVGSELSGSEEKLSPTREQQSNPR